MVTYITPPLLVGLWPRGRGHRSNNGPSQHYSLSLSLNLVGDLEAGGRVMVFKAFLHLLIIVTLVKYATRLAILLALDGL